MRCYMQVAGNAILPAAALFEAALAAAATAILQHTRAIAGPMLVEAGIAAPCQLPVGNGSVLACFVDLRCASKRILGGGVAFCLAGKERHSSGNVRGGAAEVSGVRSHLRTRLRSPAVLLPCAPARQTWSGAIRGCMSDAATQPHAAGTWAEVQRLPTGHGFCIHPAAGDACLHLAALPGASRVMGATRHVAPLCTLRCTSGRRGIGASRLSFQQPETRGQCCPADTPDQEQAAQSMGSVDAAHLSTAGRCGNRVPTAAGVVLAVPAAGTATAWAQARALDAYAGTASLASMRLCACSSATVLEVGNSHATLYSGLHVSYFRPTCCAGSTAASKMVVQVVALVAKQIPVPSQPGAPRSRVRCSSLQMHMHRPPAALTCVSCSQVARTPYTAWHGARSAPCVRRHPVAQHCNGGSRLSLVGGICRQAQADSAGSGDCTRPGRRVERACMRTLLVPRAPACQPCSSSRCSPVLATFRFLRP